MRLVVDTNTLVSGTLWHGLPGHFIEALEEGHASLVTSEALLGEFAEVVARAHLADRLLRRNVTPAKLVLRLARQAEFVSPDPLPLPAELRDPEDLIVLAAATAARVDAIVTGDQDLLSMGSFKGIRILTVRQALEALGIPTG